MSKGGIDYDVKSTIASPDEDDEEGTVGSSVGVADAEGIVVGPGVRGVGGEVFGDGGWRL
jgi:hypothetical protein